MVLVVSGMICASTLAERRGLIASDITRRQVNMLKRFGLPIAPQSWDADALVMCSDSESFGLSVAEAMAVGTPVVVTRTCPWPDVEREGAGLWVPQDADAMAAALTEILGDDERARTMGERGRALVARSYTWPAAARTIADGYRSATARSLRAAHAS